MKEDASYWIWCASTFLYGLRKFFFLYESCQSLQEITGVDTLLDGEKGNRSKTLPQQCIGEVASLLRGSWVFSEFQSKRGWMLT